MKKSFLLLVAAIGLTTTAMAQIAVTFDPTREVDNAVVAPFEAMECEQTEELASTPFGPMRSVTNGIWYVRPTGSFLYTGSTWRYVYVPPFTNLIWTNMSTEPANTQWKYGANAANNYNESQIVDNNLVTRYSKNLGTGAYYGPFVLQEDVDTFAIIDSQLSTGYPLVIAPDTIKSFLNIPTTVNYSGFTTFSYGTNQPIASTRDGASDTYLPRTFYEFYRASGQPFYLEGITLYARLPEGKTEPIAAGSEGVICYVIQAVDDSYANLDALTDTVAVIPINPVDAEISEYKEGYLTTIKAFCMEEDELGGMSQKPAILERSFVLAFEGFNNEGVDFTVNMSKVPVEEMYYNGGPYATLYYTYWTSDGAERGYFYQYNKDNGSQYNMQIRLNGMWDVVAPYNGETEYYASTEGGEIYSLGEKDGEEVQYRGLYIQSVFPYQSEESPMPSYSVEGLPDWLSITGFDGQYYTENYGFTTEITIEAQPLPAGVDGREAKFRFISEKGAKSEEFSVKQGDVSDGIENIVDEQKVENNATYNLSGQKVGGNYRGIVIKNGKKVVRK